MRLLFTFAGGAGHADPLVPLAVAARAAGHEVALAGRASALGSAAAHGLAIHPDPDPGPQPPAAITPLLPLDPAREDRVLRDGFAGRLARGRATHLLELGYGWRPDVLVREETDVGAAVAAERLCLRHATVLVMPAGAFVRDALLDGPVQALRAEHGLPPDPGLRRLRGRLVLALGPPSFRDPAFPLPPEAHSLRPAGAWPAAAPPWLAAARRRPRVYVTLGTVFNRESGDLFQRVLAGLADRSVEVVVTLGRGLDPALLGPQPPHVRLEAFVPQDAVLARCDVVVSHGGSGTVLGALAAGVPQVVLPMGADQPANAARCAALGLGVALDAVAAAPAEIGAAVRAMLEEPGYREAAARLRTECEALPGPEHAVALLEALVSGAARP